MTAGFRYQNIRNFLLPSGFRGRSAIWVQLWWFVQATLFRLSPQFLYGYRVFLLRMFGARIGKGCVIRPTATFTYPWKVKLGDYVWIGDDVVLYSLGDIAVGSHSVISQRSYLCAGDHDYEDLSFKIRARPIWIGDECWIASDVYVAPGVTVADGVVVGARSGVFTDLPEGTVCVGTPCKVVKLRPVSHICSELL